MAGSHIEFEPNPKYHGGAPKLTSLVQKYVPDQQTLYAQFQTGEVDIYDHPGHPAAALSAGQDAAGREDHAERRRRSSSSSTSTAASRSSPTSGCARRCIMAVDKKGWIDAVYYGVPSRR